jgi:uncharacterized protein (UPF0264 family)
MTWFLASVRDADEATLVLGAGADIVDLKDPKKGALGALDLGTIEACVGAVAGRAPVSATVGDLPMNEAVTDAVLATAACGVDDVKLGVLPGGEPGACFERLKAAASHVRLILVVFADAWPGFDPIAAAADVGARGVMLDTAGKHAGSLLDHMSIDEVSRFLAEARRAGLLAGVAGALRPVHVPSLIALAPDVIGFRGALCHGARRGEGLDTVACSRIRALIPADPSPPKPEFRAPHASVVC